MFLHLYTKDVPIKIDNYEFQVDIAFGGAFYAVVDCKEFGLKVDFKDLSAIQMWGGKIKHYIESKMEVKHPLEEGLKGIYGVIFSDEPKDKGATLRNVTILLMGK